MYMKERLSHLKSDKRIEEEINRILQYNIYSIISSKEDIASFPRTKSLRRRTKDIFVQVSYETITFTTFNLMRVKTASVWLQPELQSFSVFRKEFIMEGKYVGG